MVEFLSEFVMHCLSKDLNNCLTSFVSGGKDNATLNGAQLTLNSERFGSKIQAPDTGIELEPSQSF
jgi:hypothetical protein